MGAVTDESRVYTINATLKQGTYILEFSGVGFKSKVQNIQIGSAVNYTVNTNIDADALNLDEVVLIVSSLKQSRQQLGNIVICVNAKQLSITGSGNLTPSLPVNV